MLEGVLFSVGFCIFFVVTFLVLQASRLEECFKKGKVIHIRIAYFLLSFVIAFLVTYGLNYLVSLFNF
ncbi:MAG: DUF1146 family protein [Anaeroplasmataceae bacterium]|jgi:hypothetical protein|nr:DUF1146 family protein [Anaeroplasmataceae bacterium]